MTEPIEPGGRDPTPATTHEDGLPTGGHSITAARALSAPTTVDRAARTVEVVWSTGARARNFVPPLGMITEELDMSPNAVRMDGLRGGGAPVLNTHRRADARDVVGRVVTARLEAGRGYATLQFSSATDVEPLWQRIVNGTLRSVSVGYRVHRYEQIADPRDGTVHRAVDWEPYEISVVPLPVDPAAVVRSAGDDTPIPAVEPAITAPTPLPEQEPPMSDPNPSASATAIATASSQETTAPMNATITPTTQTQATGTEAATGTDANRSATTQVVTNAAAEAIRGERERIAGLGPVVAAGRALVAGATVDTLHQRAIAEGWTPEALRGALWEALAQGARPATLPANPAASDLLWLAGVVQQADRPLAIMSHVPLSGHAQTSNYYFERTPELSTYPGAERARAVLRMARVPVVCLAGHVHWNTLTVVDGIPHLTLQSLTESFTTHPGPAAAWGLWELDTSINWRVMGQDPFTAQLDARAADRRWITPLAPLVDRHRPASA